MMSRRQAEQTSEILVTFFFFVSDELLNYAPFWRGAEGTKRVRPTGKAFDDILSQNLTGHHDASQYGTSETRNKIEEQDFRSHR